MILGIDAILLWGIVVPVIIVLTGIIIAIIIFRKTASKKQLEIIERQIGGLKVHLDGLPKASDQLRSPFKRGLKAMKESKWDVAIDYFEQALEKANGTQLSALFNLIGLCHYSPGRLKEVLVNLEKAVFLAEQFNDIEGKLIALGNIVLIYQNKGDLDYALKYSVDVLRITRDIGKKTDEARALGNVGSIYAQKGKKEKALNYYNQSLEIFKQIGAQKEIEQTERIIRDLTGK